MFSASTLRHLLAAFGELRPQKATDWSGTEALPAILADFYNEIGPWGTTFYEQIGPVGCTLTVSGNPVCIPALHKLEALQAGYAWSGSPAQPLAGWNPQWLVIAEQGADPFIYDKNTGHILFAFHGAGAWEPVLFANDLYTAIGALATVATSYCALDDEDTDDGLTDKGMRCIQQQLAAALGSTSEAKRMLTAWEFNQ